jgi:hypothetical protein
MRKNIGGMFLVFVSGFRAPVRNDWCFIVNKVLFRDIVNNIKKHMNPQAKLKKSLK